MLGRLAGLRNLGDGGSSDVRSSSVVTALDGLRAVFGDDRIVHDDADASIADGADLAVVVVGYTKDDEGEYMGASDMAQLSAELFPAIDHPELGAGASDGAVRPDREVPTGAVAHRAGRWPVGGDARRPGADGARRGSSVAAAVRCR